MLYSLHVPLVGFFLRAETHAQFDVCKRTSVDVLLFVLLLIVPCVVAHHVHDKPALSGGAADAPLRRTG